MSVRENSRRAPVSGLGKSSDLKEEIVISVAPCLRNTGTSLASKEEISNQLGVENIGPEFNCINCI